MLRSFPRSLVPTGRKAHLFRGQGLNEPGNSQCGPWVKTPGGTCVTELCPVPKGLWQVGIPSWVLGWLLRHPLSPVPGLQGTFLSH